MSILRRPPGERGSHLFPEGKNGGSLYYAIDGKHYCFHAGEKFERERKLLNYIIEQDGLREEGGCRRGGRCDVGAESGTEEGTLGLIFSESDDNSQFFPFHLSFCEVDNVRPSTDELKG